MKLLYLCNLFFICCNAFTTFQQPFMVHNSLILKSNNSIQKNNYLFFNKNNNHHFNLNAKKNNDDYIEKINSFVLNTTFNIIIYYMIFYNINNSIISWLLLCYIRIYII